jgi:hypothetical protein
MSCRISRLRRVTGRVTEQCSVVGHPLVIDNPGVRVAFGDEAEDGLAVAFAARRF